MRWPFLDLALLGYREPWFAFAGPKPDPVSPPVFAEVAQLPAVVEGVGGVEQLEVIAGGRRRPIPNTASRGESPVGCGTRPSIARSSAVQ